MSRLLAVLTVVLCGQIAEGQLKFRQASAVRTNARTANQEPAELDLDTDSRRIIVDDAVVRASAAEDVDASEESETPELLPRQHNQVWREYSIEDYTSRVSTTKRPERALVDWILRETGTEVWFSEPLGVLSASEKKLRVYHTEEMQEVVSRVVDRFVDSQARQHAFRLRFVTVGSPNWRSKALPLLHRVSVRSPGVDAWLLSNEDAAVLLNDLRKRTDFQEHGQPTLAIHNGQSQAVSSLKPRNYVRGVRLASGTGPTYELESGQFQEGYTLELSPLVSADERVVEAVIKCEIDQIERMVPVSLELPGLSSRQAAQIQVPQVSSWRLHERFRWQSNRVLLLSCGVIATPDDRPRPLGLSRVLSPSSPGRADALLMIEYRGDPGSTTIGAEPTAAAPRTARY